MKNITLIFSLLVCVFIQAQPPKQFYSKYGDSGIDIGYSVKQTLDGGYIIGGSTTGSGAGNSDIYLIKLDSMGMIMWTKTLGGFNNDVGKSIIQLSDSSYVITGFTNSYGGGGYDALIVRVDKVGNTMWLRTFGGLDWDFAYDLIQLADGNLVICGSTTSFGKGKQDAFVVKYDLNGNLIWQKLYGGIEDDEFRGVYTRNGIDFFAAGMTKSYGEPNGDMYVMKMNNNGDSLIRIIYGGSLYDHCNDLTVNSIGDIYLVGGSYSNLAGNQNGNQNGIMVQYSSGGAFIKLGALGNLTNDKEIVKVISSNSSFGEIIVTYSENQNLGTKLDFVTVAVDPSLYFVAGGMSGSFGSSDNEEPYDICPTKDKGYAQVGYTKSFNAIDKDVFFVKRDSLLAYGTSIVGIKKNNLDNKSSMNIYPNPIENQREIIIDFGYKNSNKHFETSIYNLSGVLVKKQNIKVEESKGFVDVNELGKGVYILNLRNDSENFFFKILKL